LRFLAALLVSLFAGVAGGLGATWWTVSHGEGLGWQRVGPWRAAARAGGPTADPYGLATQAHDAYVPLAAGEGIALFAGADEEGRPLSGRCRYSIEGRTPTARYWTLEAFDPRGQGVAGATQRTGFTSQEIVRRADGSFRIVASPAVVPGNWLEISTRDRFFLVLRLYDTTLSANAFALEADTLPRIDREACS